MITLVVLGLLLVGSRGEGECPIAFAECETETQYLVSCFHSAKSTGMLD